MPTPTAVRDQINSLISDLVEVGLSDDQNFAFLRDGPDGLVEVTFPQAHHISIALKNISYQSIYDHLARERAFNVRLPDGALVQMLYVYAEGDLERHRLAFFPSPHLEEFQNNPDIYLNDEIYADVIARSIVPFPLRFEFDGRDAIHVPVIHPKSHLTLGQYENCRIPLSAPMTPFCFVDFVLRNFYHTAHKTYASSLTKFDGAFDDSIVDAERDVVHVQIPA